MAVSFRLSEIHLWFLAVVQFGSVQQTTSADILFFSVSISACASLLLFRLQYKIEIFRLLLSAIFEKGSVRGAF